MTLAMLACWIKDFVPFRQIEIQLIKYTSDKNNKVIVSKQFLNLIEPKKASWNNLRANRANYSPYAAALRKLLFKLVQGCNYASLSNVGEELK